MSKKILIVGGGIIGICSAYYLSKSGHDVTIIDKYGMKSGASYVNAHDKRLFGLNEIFNIIRF